MSRLRSLTVGPLRVRLRSWPLTRHTHVRDIDVRVRGRRYFILRLEARRFAAGERGIVVSFDTGRAL